MTLTEPVIDDATFIPDLIRTLRSEQTYFECADSISRLELGAYDYTNCTYYQVRSLDSIEQLFWSYTCIREKLLEFWPSPTTGRAIVWLETPTAWRALVDSFDQPHPELPNLIRHSQEFISTTLDSILAAGAAGSFCLPGSKTPRELCAFVRSSDAVGLVLDSIARTHGFRKAISAKEEIQFCLLWCLEEMKPLWMTPSVSRVLQWLSSNENILDYLVTSEFCGEGVDTIDRFSFLLALCAQALERAAGTM